MGPSLHGLESLLAPLPGPPPLSQVQGGVQQKLVSLWNINSKILLIKY